MKAVARSQHEGNTARMKVPISIRRGERKKKKKNKIKKHHTVNPTGSKHQMKEGQMQPRGCQLVKFRFSMPTKRSSSPLVFVLMVEPPVSWGLLKA